MLVKDCMTRHPIMISPETPAAEAQKIIAESKIRHLPVVGDGKRLKGLITRSRLALKPDTLASLNVWEITRLLSDVKVKQLMLKASEVITIEPHRTIERAAQIMAEHKVGCLPVIEDNIVVGILSEVDLLHAFQEMLGLPVEGVRVTMRMPDRPGEFAKLMSTLASEEWGVMGIGTFPTPRREGFYDTVIKIRYVSIEDVEKVLGQIPDQQLVDIRQGV